MVHDINWSDVSRLAEAAERGGGAIGVAVTAPGGATFAYNGDRRFCAASTIKIAIMIEIYRGIDRGERALSDMYVLRDPAKTPGSGILLHLHDGITLTLNDLIYLMMSISDNTATNILIEMTGMDRVNATMRELGCVHSTLARPMRGRPAREDEPENWATPTEFAGLIATILEGRAASAASCAAMTAMLEKQQNGRRIARHLPARDGLRWGSKTGSLTGVTNDAGFVTTEAGTVILAVFCEHLPDQHTGERTIGEISRAALHAAGILTPAEV